MQLLSRNQWWGRSVQRKQDLIRADPDLKPAHKTVPPNGSPHWSDIDQGRPTCALGMEVKQCHHTEFLGDFKTHYPNVATRMNFQRVNVPHKTIGILYISIHSIQHWEPEMHHLSSVWITTTDVAMYAKINIISRPWQVVFILKFVILQKHRSLIRTKTKSEV